MRMLLFGLIKAILLFKNRTEKNYFPVYLFNCYFLICMLLQEFTYSRRLILFLFLACLAAGVMADLAGAAASGRLKRAKREKQKTEEAEKEEREEKTQKPLMEAERMPEAKAVQETKEEPETMGESKKTKTGTRPLPELTLEEILPTYIPKKKEAVGTEKASEPATSNTKRLLEPAAKEPAGQTDIQLAGQVQELLKREETLREQRMLARRRERRYRQELAAARNKKK